MFTLFFRAILIPIVLSKYVKDPLQRSRTRPAIYSIVSIFIIVLSYYLYTTIFFIFPVIGAIPLSLLLSGLFILASRRSTTGKLIGYIVEENGILFLTAILVPTLPFIVEVGVTLDLVAVLIVAVIMKDLKLDLNLPELRG
jgi:hydrogenase-4 membrane subunit HyfE